MPGIVGIIGRSPSLNYPQLVDRMLRTMKHEPFYVSGVCGAPELGVYGGWIAHPDSFAATESTDGLSEQFGVIIAGECEHEETTSDKVPAHRGSILPLYERIGDSCVRSLNGLFSGLIIDRRRRCALLFNDRYGMERIYVHESDGATFFASEVKALLAVAPILRMFDDQGVAEYLTFGCTRNGRTLFRGVRALEAGSLWTFDHGACVKQRYFEPSEWHRQQTLSPEAFETALGQCLANAVRRSTGDGERLGISLTGGVDTRMIMAYLPTSPTPPICYTFAGCSGDTLDARIAARVAGALGLDHKVLRIRRDFLSEFSGWVDRTVHVTDGCAGAMGAHEIYLNAQARCLAPIRLTGNFGSEILRGVTTLKPQKLSPEVLTPALRALVEPLESASPLTAAQAVTSAALHQVPWTQYGTIAAARSQVVFRSPYLHNDIVALACRAPHRVPQSSRAGLKVVRDIRQPLGQIPTDRALAIDGYSVRDLVARSLAEVAFKIDYWYTEGLPTPLTPLDGVFDTLRSSGILGLHKYLPYRRWFRSRLAEYVTDVLTDSATRQLPYWDARSLAAIADDHRSGRRNCVREINSVITLARVSQLLLNGSAS